MEAATKVKLLSLKPYRHLFPEARVIDITVEKYAGVSHTVLFIPQVVKQCSWMVKDFVKQELEGLSRYEACKKLWHFVKYHIEYVPDKKTKEQVRSPRRLIHDAKGDCDCMTTFVDTCLYVLGVRGIINRITAYEAGHFQHIYSLIPDGKGKFIIMDCVVDQFNYEKPYTKKKDYTMELQFLDGIEEKRVSPFTTDLREVFDNRAALGDIGRILKRAAQRNSGGGGARKPLFKKPVIKMPAFKAPIIPKRSPEKKAAAKEKRKNFGKKVLKVANKVNKINPATVLLRAGILASMKLNVLKIAERIKWGYASPELAESKGMDMSKYGKIKSVLAKTEQIFFASGGKPENLKKAILTGNGNRNREIAGLGELADTLRLSELLGAIYSDEFINGMDGFEGFDGFEGIDGLGEPATATSLAAASTAMGALAALLKSIGDLFPNKGKKAPAPTPAPEPEPVQEQEQAPASESSESPQEEPAEQTPQEEQETSEPSQEQEQESPASEEPTEDTPSEDEAPQSEESVEGILSGVGSAIGSFYQNNKTLILGLGIGAAVISVGFAINHYSSKDKPKPSENAPLSLLNGVERKKRGRRPGSKNKKHEPEEEEIIELM